MNILLYEEKIIGLGICLVSVLGVGTPKYLIHQMAHTKGAENIAILDKFPNKLAFP